MLNAIKFHLYDITQCWIRLINAPHSTVILQICIEIMYFPHVTSNWLHYLLYVLLSLNLMGIIMKRYTWWIQKKMYDFKWMMIWRWGEWDRPTDQPTD